MLIILASFLVLGAMTVTCVIKYWKDEKHSLFSNNAYGISDFIEGNSAVINNGFYLYNENLLKTFISTFASNLNADIIITDYSGKIIMDSSDEKDKYINRKVSEEIMNTVKSGQYEDTNTLGGIFENMNYIVGTSINSKINGKMMGAVFICTDAENFLRFYKDIFYIFILASIISLLASFWIVRWLSYDLTEPLRQISEVAQSVGRGDFSKRVDVKSDDEIGNLAKVFNDMTDSLSRSEQVRRDFIANVSHELKTPMTTISGFVDGILDGTIPEDKQKHYLNIVSTEIKRLSRLVKVMLSLSRIDSDSMKLNFRNVDITQMILSVLMTFENDINSKNINIIGFENSGSITAELDKDMMYQVIYNLLENAVKFTDNGGYININISENNNNTLEISIKNSGTGISSQDIHYVFDKFYKTDKSRSIDKKGLGLGLYIVKKIVKLHSGDINVKSKVGEYTQFNLYIPKKQNKNFR